MFHLRKPSLRKRITIQEDSFSIEKRLKKGITCFNGKGCVGLEPKVT
jgi:hypothetical protein